MVRRLQIRFRKEGDLRLIGHLDLLRAWERMLRRAGVPLVMTSGCHPRPRLNFPSALAMGEAGENEVLEVDLDGPQSVAQIHEALVATAPAGLVPTQVMETMPHVRSAEASEFAYEFVLPADRTQVTSKRLANLLADGELLVSRRSGVAVDLRHLLISAEVVADVLRFRVRATHEQNLRARDVLAALGLADLRDGGQHPTRTEVALKS